MEKAYGVLAKINGSEKAREIIHDIKNTVTVKTEKLFSYGFMCIFVGVMLSVFQQAVGINACALLCASYLPGYGYGQSDGSDRYYGCCEYLVYAGCCLYGREAGPQAIAYLRFHRYGSRALGVALTFGNEAFSTVTMLSIMVYSASFMFSWGPIAWVLIAELFPNTIRGAAVAIAVAFQWIFNFIVSSTFVPMFNMHLTPGDDFGHWFTYGLYGAICILAAFFVWKLVPETKGKSLEDMSKLWKKD